MTRTPEAADAGTAAAALSWPAAGWATIARHLPVIVQLALSVWVVHLYDIEGPTFFRVFVLAAAGFAVNLVLPRAYRLQFFVLLSAAGAVIVFGWSDAAWLLTTGLILIGICHLPVSIKARTAVLLAAGAGLAAARAGWVGTPWTVAIWPILGSMFMFRLVLYMLAAKAGKVAGGFWAATAYFFMLPNLAFPLFPVIDYQTFRRTYYDKDDGAIYEQGMMWIARGLVHLLLYRLVYQRVLMDPVDVVGLGDLVQFMVGTFLLYLRVSGQFHLIVGILHLFGFRLPETHKLYYLAHSFTELWRRINIYWTDFMTKAVFYPTWFKVKRLGPTRALVVSTAMVFAVTWILHSYQWFWLRGGFPLTPQDTLFWGILGALVIVGAVRESNAVRKPGDKPTGWSLRLGLRAAATFSAFCFLWSLWSTESVAQWIWMLGAAGNVDLKGVGLILLTLTIVTVFGGKDWEASKTAQPSPMAWAFQPATRTAVSLVLLLIAAQPAVRAIAPPAVADGLTALHTTGLNARDAALQHRGYYEQLDVRAQLNAEVLDVVTRRANWVDLSQIGVIRDRQDFLVRDLYPSRHVNWNGNEFSTNRWGMRDKDYTREKPPGTLRIAILGPSHVMGNGVADGEAFETLVEDRLNASGVLGGYDRVEVLNFGVDGYSLTQQVAMLEDRVLGFDPDVVIATHYQRNRSMTESYLLKVVWGGYEIPYEPVRALLAEAGLMDIDHGGLPIPFQSVRNLVRRAGLDPRMPESEASARVHQVADRVLEWSIAHFADLTSRHGIVPAVLGLNVVIDDVATEVPNHEAIERLGLPLFDLFDVFPAPDRPALRITPWDDHPNAAGHRLIADRLYAELVPLLESRFSPAEAFTRTTTPD